MHTVVKKYKKENKFWISLLKICTMKVVRCYEWYCLSVRGAFIPSGLLPTLRSFKRYATYRSQICKHLHLYMICLEHKPLPTRSFKTEGSIYSPLHETTVTFGVRRTVIPIQQFMISTHMWCEKKDYKILVKFVRRGCFNSLWLFERLIPTVVTLCGDKAIQNDT